ncbi:hypothetical protein M0805_009635 [Coniferiporia weirii]|nr:hypothetical protein M0805_009635 [Coniferiporia weirii]
MVGFLLLCRTLLHNVLQTNTQAHSSEPPTSNDLFAVLTTPSSPSSSRRPVFQAPAPTSAVQITRSRRSLDRDTASPESSEFGSFVSVSAAEDPLFSGTESFDVISDSEAAKIRQAPPFVNFGKLTEEARIRSERNERRVLDELHVHEDDPLAWLGTTGTKPSPRGVDNERQNENVDEDPVASALHEAGTTLIDLDTPSSESAPPLPVPSPDFRPSTLPRTASDTVVHRIRSRSPPTFPASLSSSFNASLPRSWMSTLLSARSAPAQPSPSSALGLTSSDASSERHEANLSTSPSQTALHALFTRANTQSPPSPTSQPARHFRFSTEGHMPAHAATLPATLPSADTLKSTGPSPFAAHAYLAPSGAPGFGGDRNWNPAQFEFEVGKGGVSAGKGVTLVGRKEPTIPVLDEVLATALRVHLSALARLPYSWTLLYSADQHGLSLNTLYARCAPSEVVGGGGKLPDAASGSALIALQDADGGVFGAWIGEGIHLSHGSYYGGGDSFLWRVDPHEPHELKVYKWTGRNGYVAFCDTDGFSFGGGEGHYGLYVDGNLIEGTTHPCPTFDNECLAQGTRRGRMVAFDCVGLEVWGIGP